MRNALIRGNGPKLTIGTLNESSPSDVTMQRKASAVAIHGSNEKTLFVYDRLVKYLRRRNHKYVA